jgi:osmoprotectant transport system substrate-binding protein
MKRTIVVGLAAISLILAACGGSDDAASDTTVAPETGGDVTAVCAADSPEIVIGSQDFGESLILAEIYGQALTEAGCQVRLQALGGFRDLVFTSFEAGQINFTPEYAASALEFLNGFAGEASGDIVPTVAALQTQLAPLGLVALDASPAVDSNAFVVTAETAERLGLRRVSDLTEGLRFGAPPDCADNAACLPGLLSVYGLDLSATYIPLDGGGPLTVTALEGGEIDVGILFSTDGVIADKGWVVLEDDRGLINADNIIPIATIALVEANGPGFVALIDRISAALDTAQLTELNRQYGIDLEDADKVARQWLSSTGFVN